MATLDGDALAAQTIAALEAIGKLATKKKRWEITVDQALAETTYTVTARAPDSSWAFTAEVGVGPNDDVPSEVGAVLEAGLSADEAIGTLFEVAHNGAGVITLTGVTAAVLFEVEVGANLSAVQLADVDDAATLAETTEIQEAIAGAIVDHIQAARFTDAAPASPTAAGQAGQMYHDAVSEFIYLCVADDTWVRYSVATSF